MGLTLSVARSLSLSAETAARVDPGVLGQSFKAAIGWSPAASLRLGVTGGASKRASGYVPSGDWYLSWWADAFRHLAPWSGGTDDWRRLSLAAEARALLRPVGLSLQGELASSSGGFVSGRRRQDTTLSYGVSLPVALRPGDGPELTVSAAYGQKLDLSALAEEGGAGFAEDLSEVGAILSHHAWMLAWVPGVEVVSRRALESVEARLRDGNDYPVIGARWEPSLTLGLSRGPGSRLLDLVVPAFLDVTFARGVRLDGDLAEGTTKLSAALRTTALNLFGRTGAYQLFSFYDTDEIAGTARVALSVPLDESVPPTADFTLNSLASLSSKKRFGVDVENKLRLRWGPEAGVAEVGELRVSWVALRGIPVPSLLRGEAWRQSVRKATGELKHVERLGVSLRGPFGAAGSGAAVTFRHESVLEYAGLGSARAHAGLGVELLDESGAWTPGVGIEGGVEVELRF